MPSWGNYDNAANAPYWAVNASIIKNNPRQSAPTAANVALLYANTTANVYIQDTTIGVFGVDAQESLATHAQHTGWVLRTVGQGGRAGRTTNEVLVALSSMNGPDGDGQTYANVAITFTGSPAAATVVANTSNTNVASFSVSTSLTGNTAATLTYQWQVNSNTGSLGWTNVANNTPTATRYAGGTSSTLQVIPYNATANQYVVRAIVTAADQGVSATSSNATVTIM